MCKGGKPATSTATSSPDPQAMALYSNLLNRASGVADTPYTQYTGQLVAPMNQQQQLGVGNINAAQPYFQQAGQLASGIATPLTEDEIRRYQDPYIQDVVKATQANFNENNAQAEQKLQSQAAMQGALGGNRVGVAGAELARQQQLAQNPVIADLYSKSYGQGLSTSLQMKDLMSRGVSGMLSAGQGALGVAGAQLGAGSLEQQTQQAQNEAAYGQWQNQQAYPFQTTQWLANLGTGVGSQMGGTSYNTGMPAGPSTSSQILGGVTSGIGMLGATGAFGSAGWLMPALAALARGGRVKGYAGGGGVIPDDVVPESEDTLLAQQDQLARGDRKVQMFPKGTPELDPPAGMGRFENDRGSFHFDPSKIDADGVASASKAGRENELLDLGPYSKEDIAKLVEQGSPPLVIVERDPQGIEVRAALGTPETVPVQLQKMEETKSPENTISVEDLFAKLRERQESGVAGGEEPQGFASGGAPKKIGATPWSNANGYISVPEFNMVRGKGAPGIPSLPSDPGGGANPASKLGSLGGMGGAAKSTDDNSYANAFPDPGPNSYVSFGGQQVPVFGQYGVAGGTPYARGGGVAGSIDPAVLQSVYGIDRIPGMAEGGAVDAAPNFDFESQFPEAPAPGAPLWYNPDAASAFGVAAPQEPQPAAPANVPMPRNKPEVMYDNPYKRLAAAEAEKHGIPPEQFFGLLQQESNWNPDAVSKAGAGGIAQFMPATARGVGLEDRFDPMQAIPAAAAHFKELYNKYGDWDLAKAGYNASPGAVAKYKSGAGPLPAETQNYIQSINAMAKDKPRLMADGPARPATRMAGVAPAQEGSDEDGLPRMSYASEDGNDAQVMPAAFRSVDAPRANGVDAPVGMPPAAPKSKNGIDWSGDGKLWPSLIAAGMGMLASRSPHAGVAIGEGGLAGIQGYSQMAEAEKARGQSQQRIDLEAKRLQQAADVNARQARQAEYPYTRLTKQQELLAKRPFQIGTDPLTMSPIFGIPDAEAPGGYRILDPKTLKPGPTGAPGAPAPAAPPLTPAQQEAENKPPVWETGGVADDKPESKLPVREYSQGPISSDISSAGVAKTDKITDDYIQKYVEDADRLAKRRMRARWNTDALDAAKAENPKAAEYAEAILEGRQPVPTALTGKYGTQNRAAMEIVRATDPEFDQSYFASKKKARDAFTTGVEGRQIRKFNTTMGHIGEMIMLGRELDNYDSGFGSSVLNKGVAKWREFNQDPRLVSYKQTSNAVANELEGAFRGNNTAIAGIQHWRETIAKPDISPQELQSASKNLIHLLGSQIESSTAQYAAGLRAPVDTLSLMTAPNREMYKRILNDQNPIVMKFKSPEEAAEAFKKKRLQVGDDFVDPSGTQRKLTPEGAKALGGGKPAVPGAPAAASKPSLAEFLTKAKEANPGATDEQLTEFYKKKYGAQ